MGRHVFVLGAAEDPSVRERARKLYMRTCMLSLRSDWSLFVVAVMLAIDVSKSIELLVV